MFRKAILILLFGHLAASAFGAKGITVEQLNNEVAASHGKQDKKIADRLFKLELTERLSAAKLAEMEAALPGPESRRALVALADQAEFLPPPPADIPNQPAPSFEQQREITAKAIDYVMKTLRRLPNVIARRDTIRFEDMPAVLKTATLSSPSGTFIPAQPLHPVGRYTKEVSYRDGEEIDQAAGEAKSAESSATTGLNSVGEFGPILSVIFGDLPQGKLQWSRWERGPTGPAAVFSFTVPREASHYEVRFCCINGAEFHQFAAYHGEIRIAPADGTIERLVLITDLNKGDPVKKANLLVEYGPVDFAGRTFYCPSRSISIIVAPVQVNHSDALPSRGVIQTPRGNVNFEVQNYGGSDQPPQTFMNEVVFDQYHLFYSEARVLAGNNSQPAATPVATANAPTVPEESIEVKSEATPSRSSEISAPTEPMVSRAPNAEAAAAPPENAMPAVVAAAPAAPEAPEIRVTPQHTPSIPDFAPGEAKFSLRVTTRIVEVNVSAFDKKGRPVTDLKPEDFEIYDGGSRQALRSFGRAVAPSGAPTSADEAAKPAEYSNRLGASGNDEMRAGSAPAENATVIFFDATSLHFDDLNNARQQVIKILGKLPPAEPVGLYSRVGFGFRVLLEPTMDRAALSAALRGWMPDAKDLARAQDAETRNRQQFDTLRNPTAVGTTYASVGGFGGGSMIDSDPRLFSQGEDPPREALSVLVAVAAHLGAIRGHKNLVWIASDNVLANWSDQSADGDAGRMGPNSIGAFSIRTQEALNNAHVSLYPFDASQLETDATDASLQNAGVQLDAAVKDQYPGFKAPPGGRSMSQMRQQTHPIQAAMQQLATSTGGRTFGRSSNVVANLNRVIEDSKAIYLLSFAPDTQPDDKYHQLKVAIPTRRDITLRYRTGYLYAKEPASVKERFTQVLWQPFDASEIALSARRKPATGGVAVALNIAATDVGFIQNGDRWSGKLDVFLVQRDDTGVGARVMQQTLALDLPADSHEKFMRDGIPFEQYLSREQNAEAVRIIVVDENSGHIGSLTLPAEPDGLKP